MIDLRRFRWVLAACLLPLTAAYAGWNFDTAVSPEKARDLLTAPGVPIAPAGSWLRIREMGSSRVYDPMHVEIPIAPDMGRVPSVTERRDALLALRKQGYRLVAVVGWPSASWTGGVRPDQPLRRLPLDLREPAERCRQLAETYGDLVDYWEILSEPDISFVEENPETYAAYLKACYLGFKAAGQKSSSSGEGTSLVLCGSFALPPGPYFDAWLANDGLRYIEAFNYHFYGYAEDFTGVYQQFQATVAQAPAATPADESVFQTQFYPDPAAWKTRVLSRFSPNEGDDQANRAILLNRPLASAEPILQADGRWLVSPGTSVRETEAGWEFTVTSPAPGPMRPATAELPLPAHWPIGVNRHLAFEFRVENPAGIETTSADAVIPPSPPTPPPSHSSISYSSAVPESSVPVSKTPGAPARELPVFLTEYGYGLLDGRARLTAAGRETQQRWFARVQEQLRTLGIDRALGFNLQPNYNPELGEFGLLMDSTSGPPPPDSAGKWNGLSPSPALTTLLLENATPITPRPWIISTTDPSPVVIDFAPGAQLTLAKSRCSYVLQGGSATGQLLLYNFSEQTVTGELVLGGTAWTLPDHTRSRAIRLAPGERCAVGLIIAPQDSEAYTPQPVTACFRVGAVPVPRVLPSEPAITQSLTPSAGPTPTPVTPVVNDQTPVAYLDVFIRTQNGNRYQNWPRRSVRKTWEWYVEPLVSFTPVFFSRAYLPAALLANEPAALVFSLRPKRYPATFLIRHASLVEIVPRDSARKN